MNPISALVMAFVLFIVPVYGQTSSPCTASMLSTLTPCMNFLSNSSANSTSPTAGCCTSLNSLTTGGMNCLCLVVAGNIPLPITINRTLAISLPQACNMSGVPVQCKAVDAPVPAPGPVSISPSLSPGVSSSASPPADVPSQLVPPSQAPEGDNTVLTPPSSVSSEAPPSATGSRPVPIPSAAMPSYSFSACLMFSSLALATLKTY